MRDCVCSRVGPCISPDGRVVLGGASNGLNSHNHKVAEVVRQVELEVVGCRRSDSVLPDLDLELVREPGVGVKCIRRHPAVYSVLAPGINGNISINDLTHLTMRKVDER